MKQRHPVNDASHPRGSAWRSCFAVFLAVLALSASSSLGADEGRFEVRSGYTVLRDGVYYLNARIDYKLPASAEEALLSGVSLTLEVQIEVSRTRRFLPDKEIAELRQRYSLQYHALSERYIVRNVNSGEQASYASLGTAAERLGMLRDLPLLDAALVEPDARHEVRLRAVLDIRRLPVPLRVFAFFLDEWRVASRWFTWRLGSTD